MEKLSQDELHTWENKHFLSQLALMSVPSAPAAPPPAGPSVSLAPDLILFSDLPGQDTSQHTSNNIGQGIVLTFPLTTQLPVPDPELIAEMICLDRPGVNRPCSHHGRSHTGSSPSSHGHPGNRPQSSPPLQPPKHLRANDIEEHLKSLHQPHSTHMQPRNHEKNRRADEWKRVFMQQAERIFPWLKVLLVNKSITS